jgi:hypothetical protein
VTQLRRRRGAIIQDHPTYSPTRNNEFLCQARDGEDRNLSTHRGDRSERAIEYKSSIDLIGNDWHLMLSVRKSSIIRKLGEDQPGYLHDANEMFTRVARAAWIRWIGDENCFSVLINQTIHIIQIAFPFLLGLGDEISREQIKRERQRKGPEVHNASHAHRVIQ